ncbi:hybrid sensor histidine kinase/response regulator [Shewanella hanedai]|uniref:histidine kinase n=1 Tax=Shewanella hanedai TaxID=25 RepID=A0A553JRP4_SHEHA|nr:two-component regulator propeller domain-containing protein [Shewanella hanedai]TRY15128.1 response regulator [Shewanella hanedai]GGI74458.1 hybrid sensor histidine kinase/response regulator [Shewanella hanedai]
MHYKFSIIFFITKLLLSCILTLLPTILLAVESSIHLDNMSKRDGLSDGTINAIVQDHQGFIWIATENGLNRYDGAQVKYFKHDSYDESSISSNKVRSLLKDSNDILWVGTTSGLNKYNPYSETFKHYNFSGNNVLNYVSVNTISEDGLGNIWIGTMDQGVYRIDIKNEKIEHFQNLDNEPTSLLDNTVWKLFKDSYGDLWVGTNKGLQKYVPRLNNFIKFNSSKLDNESMFKGAVNSIVEDSFGSLWLGGSGISKYNYQTGEFEQVFIPKDISENNIYPVYALSIGQEERVWIGTKNGLIVYDFRNQQFNYYKQQISDQNSLISDHINYIFTDIQAITWIGTKSGISKYHNNLQTFNHVRVQPDNLDGLSSNNVMSILEDSRKNLWVGSDKGIDRFDSKNNKLKKLFNINDPVSVRLIFEDSSNNIWVGTWGHGLYHYNSEKDSLISVQFPSHISQTFISKIIESRFGFIWIGTSKGIIKYDKTSSEYTYLKHNLLGQQSLDNYIVSSLLEDRHGMLWIGTNKGLYQYNPISETLKRYIHDAFNKSSLNSNDVHDIAEDYLGTLWVATTVGFNKYLPSIDAFTHGQKTLCLTDNTINAILEDDSNQLWFSSNSGLVQFNPESELYNNYDVYDGLQSNKFYKNSAFRNSKGELFFGGSNGFNRFIPEAINKNDFLPPVVITGFSLFNKSVPIRKNTSLSSASISKEKVEAKNNFMLLHSITQTKILKLSYLQSMFSFEFAALNYFNSNKNQYAYKMEGHDKEWIMTNSKNRIATYTNLDSGEYIFRVKASNNNNLWNDEGTSIRIHISPPWWKSNVIYIVYLLLMLLTIYLFVVFRTRRLTRQSHILELTVAERTQEIENLLSMKEQEFANISHELRTPLTLIIGPITELLRIEQQDEKIKSLKLIKRNGNRLLRLIEQLLNIESFRVKSVTEQGVQSFSFLISSIVDVFSDFAKDNNIELRIINLENVFFSFTQDAFDKVMLNLLSNAIKYTQSGGVITVYSERTIANELMIEVKDSGIGIAEELQGVVFERFTRGQDSINEQVTGSGIGLALVKEIVEMHQGYIDLESKVNQGTTIRVYLPIINEVSREQFDLTNNSSHNNIVNLGLPEQVSLRGLREQTKDGSDLTKYNNLTKRSIKSDDTQTSLLLVEDDPDMRQFLIDTIGKKYQVFIARDGEQGFNIATTEVPDIIISDVMMPVMNGINMVRKLKSQKTTSHIPIIFLTAKGDHKSRMVGLQEQANDYLVKPFNADELLLRVSNLLLIQSQLRHKFIKQLEELKLKKSPFNSPKLSAKQIGIIENNTTQDGTVHNDFAPSELAEHYFMQQVNEYLNDNFQHENINVDSLANALSISERQLRRKFKALIAMTPGDYLRHFRLERAALLLGQGKPAGDVSFLVGYSSHSSFSQSFKQKYGVAPSDFTTR